MFEDAKKLQDKLIKIGDKEPVQVAELLEMQQVLDEKILKEHGKEEYPEDEVNYHTPKGMWFYGRCFIKRIWIRTQ